jgi:hypothetical protein
MTQLAVSLRYHGVLLGRGRAGRPFGPLTDGLRQRVAAAGRRVERTSQAILAKASAANSLRRRRRRSEMVGGGSCGPLGPEYQPVVAVPQPSFFC